MKTLNHIGTVLLVEAIVLCVIASFRLINPLSAAIQSLATLLVFNIIFLALFFQLDGKLNLKLLLIVFGNFIGLCWTFIFHGLSVAGATFFGSTFNHLSLIFFPFLSSLWIVSFWSLSITILRLINFYEEYHV